MGRGLRAQEASGRANSAEGSAAHTPRGGLRKSCRLRQKRWADCAASRDELSWPHTLVGRSIVSTWDDLLDVRRSCSLVVGWAHRVAVVWLLVRGGVGGFMLRHREVG